MTDFQNPGTIATAPQGATTVSPTAALDFTARTAACFGEDVHVVGSTRQAGWEKQDGAVYDMEVLSIGGAVNLAAVGATSGKPYSVLGYGLHQRLTRDASSGTAITTAHIEKWWLLLDTETWKLYHFSQKYDLVTSPWSYVVTAFDEECIQL